MQSNKQTNYSVHLWRPLILRCVALRAKKARREGWRERGKRKKEKKRKTPKCVDVRRSVWNAVWENAWPKTTEANSALRLAWPAPKKHELRRQRPRQRQEIAEHAPQKCGLTLAETNTIPPPRKKKKKTEMSLFISCGDLCGNVIWWRRIWPNGIWALERHTIPYTCGKGSSRLL